MTAEMPQSTPFLEKKYNSRHASLGELYAFFYDKLMGENFGSLGPSSWSRTR